MKIVAFSDYRVQDIPKTFEFVSKQKPDLILYAGDDVHRFAPLPKQQLEKLLVENKTREGLQICQSPFFDSWTRNLSDNSVRKVSWTTQLADCIFFNISISDKISEEKIKSKISNLVTKTKTKNFPNAITRIKHIAEERETNVPQLIKKSTLVYKKTKSTVKGIIYFPEYAEDYIQKFGSIAKHGFLGVIGNDDNPIYKSLLVGKGKHDLHESAKTIQNTVILGQESDSLSEAGGIGIKIYSESEVEKHLNSLIKNNSKKNSILVSHTPPFGILDHAVRFGDRHIGSPMVRKFIAKNKPILVLCGHVHSHGGCMSKIGKTTVINLASHDYENSAGRVCIIEISKDMKIKTKWVLVSQDKIISYTPRFLNEGESLNSVFNLHGIGIKKAEKMEMDGFRTIDDIVDVGKEKLEKLLNLTPKSAEKLFLKAQSLKEGKIIPISEMVIPKSKFLFIDIETDLVQSYIWFISIYVEGKKILKQFYARKPDNEEKILNDFVNFCKKYQDHVFCYYSGSGFDERIIKQRLNHHGIDLSIGNWFDLCLAIKRSVILPTGSYSLKIVGSYFGYTYKHTDLDGFAVAMAYQQSIEKRTPKLSKKFFDYAKDDVVVLDHVMSKLGGISGMKIQREIELSLDTLPVDFEKECEKLQSLKNKGIRIKELSSRYNKGEDYIKTRLNSTPAKFKNCKIKFKKYSSEKHKFIAQTGKILKQISPNIYQIKSKNDIFNIGKNQFQITK